MTDWLKIIGITAFVIIVLTLVPLYLWRISFSWSITHTILADFFPILLWQTLVDNRTVVNRRLQAKYSLVVDDEMPDNLLWISHTLLEQDILLAATRVGGVHVLWLPNDSGKSTSVRHIARKLQSANQVEVLTVVPKFNPKEALSVTIFGETFGYNENLASFLPRSFGEKRLVVFIDQFDNVRKHYDLENFIVGLAVDSSESGKYVVILAISDPMLAETVLEWNGGQKITSIGRYCAVRHRWNATQVKEQLASMPITKNWPQEHRAKIIELGVLGGSPGFVRHMVNSYRPGMGLDWYYYTRAQNLNITWSLQPILQKKQALRATK